MGILSGCKARTVQKLNQRFEVVNVWKLDR